MTRIKAHIAASLLLLAIGALSNAHADDASGPTTATANLSNFSYELLDLAPDDGIAPGLTFTAHTTSAEVYAYNTPSFDRVVQQDHLYKPGTTSVENSDGSARAELGEHLLTASASAGHTGFAAAANSFYEFTLAPNTRVLFTGTSTTGASPGGPGPFESGGFITMQGRIVVNDQQLSTNEAVARSTSGSRSVPMAVALYAGDGPETGQLWLYASAIAHGVPPIPEPGESVMLLAGLGLLGSVVRRASAYPPIKGPARS
jgi:hypothetical protein